MEGGGEQVGHEEVLVHQNPENDSPEGSVEEALNSRNENVQALKDLVQERLSTLQDSLMDGMETNETEKQQIEEEKQKLMAVYDKLGSLTTDLKSKVDCDEELAKSTASVLAEAQGLIEDFSNHDGAKAFIEKAKGLFNDVETSTATADILNKLQKKLVENKSSLQQYFKQSPELLKRLNEVIASGTSMTSNTSYKDVLDKVAEKTDGLVKLKGAENGREDNGAEINLEEFLKENADTVLMPYIKEKAVVLSQKLKDFREGGQGQEYITKGLELLSSRQQDILANLGTDKMDADEVINWGERIIRDAEARNELINKIKDSVLDFLISYLPTVSIPPIEGDKEGLLYKIENLDLKGFKLRKEFVDVTVNGYDQIVKGAPFVIISVSEVAAQLESIGWSFEQNYFPRLSGGGNADALMKNGSVEIGLQLIKAPLTEKQQEKLLEGSGEAATLAVQTSVDGTKWTPQLHLSGCDVQIETIELAVKDTQLAWLYNTMTELFSESIRLYIISLLQDTLLEHMSSLSSTLNQFVSENWPAVSSFIDINIAQLPDEKLASQFMYNERLSKMSQKQQRKDAYSVTFAEKGALGLVFAQRNEFVVVKEFKRGPGNQILPAERGGEIKIGDILVAHDGQQITSLPLDRVMERLKKAGRPLHLTFMVPLEAPSVTREGSGSLKESPASAFIRAIFPSEKLYLSLASRWEGKSDQAEKATFAAFVKGFRAMENGEKSPVEIQGQIKPGMVLCKVAGYSTIGKSFAEACNMIKAIPKRPLELSFSKDPLYTVKFDQELPTDLRLTVLPGGHVVVTGLTPVQGPAEAQINETIEKGHIVKALNGSPLPKGKFNDVVKELKTAKHPYTVRFGNAENDDSDCEATFKDDGPMGIIFYRSPQNDVAFKAFSAFPGPAKQTKQIEVGHVLMAINEHSKLPTEQEALDTLFQENMKLPLTMKFCDMELQNQIEQS